MEIYWCLLTGAMVSLGSSSLRRAILAGYANKIAARMSRHNGYKTFGQTSTMAQLHPSSCALPADEDGLLPEWIIYHELVQTSRTFLSKASAFAGTCFSRCHWMKANQFTVFRLLHILAVHLQVDRSRHDKLELMAEVQVCILCEPDESQTGLLLRIDALNS